MEKSKCRITLSVCMLLFVGFAVLFQKFLTIRGIPESELSNYINIELLISAIVFWIPLVAFNKTIVLGVIKSIRQCLSNENGEKLEKNYYESYCFGKKGRIDFASCAIGALICLPIYVIYQIDILPNSSSLIICAILFCVLLCAKTKNKYGWMCILVMACGLAYYLYIGQDIEVIKNVISNSKLIEIVIFTAVAGVFFIAGSAIYPLIGLVKFFFNIKLEGYFEYPIQSVSKLMGNLKNIRTLFIWLTFVNIAAYIHLFVIVNLLGINTDRITEILFICGSFLPLMTFLAVSYLYRELRYDIYQLHIEKVMSAMKNRECDYTEICQVRTETYKQFKLCLYSDGFSNILTIAANITAIVVAILWK